MYLGKAKFLSQFLCVFCFYPLFEAFILLFITLKPAVKLNQTLVVRKPAFCMQHILSALMEL